MKQEYLPDNVTAVNVTTNRMTLTWSPPSSDLGKRGKPCQYRIELKTLTEKQPFNRTEVLDASTFNYVFDKLPRFTPFLVEVSAIPCSGEAPQGKRLKVSTAKKDI